MSEANSFVTLTYDDEHLPEDRSVDVEEWKRFAKRLRKLVGPFRFFHCGEYGKEKRRAHYHACLFGVDFREDRRFWKKTANGSALFVSDRLTKTWQNGFATIGSVEFDSAAYVAQYCLKKASGTQLELTFADGMTGQVRPEYGTMSRRPGLGWRWFEKYWKELYRHDSVIAKGREFPVPRYYDGLLKEMDPEAFERVRARRVARAIERQKRSRDEREEHERLRAKEKVVRANINLAADRRFGDGV